MEEPGIEILHMLNIQMQGYMEKEPLKNSYERSNNLLPTFKRP